jgi:shikimate dehydrogenase
MHAAAYRALDLHDVEYVAVDCPDERSVMAKVDALRLGELAGANVTVPWKLYALRLADNADELARRTGAANVLAVSAGAVHAHNTDVAALADELAAGYPGASMAAIIGGGGAALAAVAACRALGVDSIFVVARRWRAETPPAEWPQADAFVAAGAHPVAWPAGNEEPWHAAVCSSDVIIQATSAGMDGAEPGNAVRDIVPWNELRAGAFAYDAVYNPRVTPFLEAAERARVRSAGGLGMLVGQAARAIELWLGRRPPVDVMREAAEAELARRART